MALRAARRRRRPRDRVRGEVDPPVGESAASELAGLRSTKARIAGEGGENRIHDGSAAVEVELDDILAGGAVRPGEEEGDRVVE